MGALMRLIRHARKDVKAALFSILLVICVCLPTWGAGTCSNFIAAGGFEYDEIKLVDETRQWVGSSSNNYPPIYICDGTYYDLCNEDTNPNYARNGTGWAWFGGIPSTDPQAEFPEVVFLAQNLTITIPSGGIVPLQFYLWTESGTTAETDYVRVMMDGAPLPLFSTTASNTRYQAGYAPVTINLSAYADGNVHNLRFESVINSTTSFFVDDVSRPDKKFVNISKDIDFADDLLQPLIETTLLAHQEIRAQTHDGTEDILVNLDASSYELNLKGGYGCDFAGTPAINSTTSIQSLEVQRGTVTVENISVESPASMTGLVIKSGGKVIARNMVVKKSP